MIIKQQKYKQMKNLIFIIGCLLLAIIFSCEKEQTDFRKFFNGQEIIYTGSVGKVVSKPGNLRTLLRWKSSTDPSIVKYVVYYNQKDSQVVNITSKTDSVSALIENLQEFTYTFTIYSFDSKGNKSIPTTVNNIKVYGPTYQAGLLNRAYDASNPYVAMENGDVELNFNVPDTINVTTKVRYTSKSGPIKEVDLAPNVNVLKLTDYKPNTAITYRSSYIPGNGSLDVFTVAEYSTFPEILFYIPCDKSLFKEVHLTNDVQTYESGTSISKLWDGSVGPQGYPNIFHSDGSYIPHVLTFDMGKTYNNLARIEETGRDCCNNPDRFEVWGINDLTNATTTLRSDNAGWKEEALAKGWVLLKDASRTDEGKNAMKFDLISNPPPIRYIRIRVLHTTTGSGYSNMSELTFWNKQ